MSDENGGKGGAGAGVKRMVTPLLLLVCLTLVGFWEIMANRTRNPFRPFSLTAEDFADFQPVAAGWSFQSLPVAATPAEPNILAFRMRNDAGGLNILYRLVHGYNMPDCMRIKGYKVELVEEKVGGDSGRIQVWRLISMTGDVSIWATGVVNAHSFAFLDIDVRSMAFPRVGVPDDPNWLPRGLSLASLKNPICNLRVFLRSKWNSARCDIATFLKLKTPSWAENEVLTSVSVYECRAGGAGVEAQASRAVISAQLLMQSNLASWGVRRSG